MRTVARQSSWRRNLDVRDVNGVCEDVGRRRRPCYTRRVGWKAKDRGLWLTLAALTVLLVVLAALQYRWTSEIGRAEAERRQAQLERSAWRFAGAFDRETGPAPDRLLPHGAGSPGRRPARPPPGAPRGLADATSTRRSSPRSCSPRARRRARSRSRPVPRPRRRSARSRGRRSSSRCGSRLRRPRARREGSSSARVAPRSAAGPPLPARGRRELRRGGPPSGGDPSTSRASSSCSSTRVYLREQLLPQLAEAHFGPVAESEFVVAVVRRADRSVVFSTDPPDGDGAPARRRAAQPSRARRKAGPDRPDLVPGPRSGERPPDDGPRRREARRPAEEESPWLLVGPPPRAAPWSRRWRGCAGGISRVGLGTLALLGATARPPRHRRAEGPATRAAADGVRGRRHPRAQHPARRDPLRRPEPGRRHRHRSRPGAPLRRPHREGGRPAHRPRGPGARLRRDRVRATARTPPSPCRSPASSTRCCATAASRSIRPG